MPIRPRRSVLYMPGSNQRALEKARSLAADSLVLDLEDSVGPEKKAEARAQVIAAVNAGGYGSREVIIRANGLDTPWGKEDIKAIAQSAADGVCLPKVESKNDVLAALDIMHEVGAAGSMQVWVMVETPLGVSNIDEITASSPLMTAILMGTTDLAKDLRVPHTADRIGLQYALSRCVLSARTYEKEIFDGVYLDLEDDAGYRASCLQGRDLGFDGKTLIHPKQLVAANEVFGPSAADIERANKIISAWQQAEAEGKGVVVVDGRLVEGMHVDEAKRHLQIAQSIEQLVNDSFSAT